MKYDKKKDGVFYHPSYGRIMEHRHYATRIFWSTAMLDYLRRHFAATINQELCEELGVSMRTMIRKARELGLQKDTQWLKGVWNTNRHLAQASSRINGNSGQWRKGERSNPAGEFKAGHHLTTEQEQRRREAMRRWHRQHPDVARQAALQAWETRRQRYPETLGRTKDTTVISQQAAVSPLQQNNQI